MYMCFFLRDHNWTFRNLNHLNPGDTIFKAADSNNDGFLSYTEFVAF